MPFELHINPDHLREVFEYIKELLDEVTLHVGSNAVTIDECNRVGAVINPLHNAYGVHKGKGMEGYAEH